NGGENTSSVRSPVKQPSASPVNPSLNPSVRLPVNSSTTRPVRWSTSSLIPTNWQVNLRSPRPGRRLCLRDYVPGAGGPSRSDATTERGSDDPGCYHYLRC